MSKMINVLIIFLMFLIAVSCKKDPPVVPPPIVQIDTTRHEINWIIDDIGEYGSILRDVAIIDENNIWAVGELFKRFTVMTLAYNVVHWDGQKWEYQIFIIIQDCSGLYLQSSIICIC